MDCRPLALTAAVFAIALAGTLPADSQPGHSPREGTAPQWAPLVSPAAVGSMAPQILSLIHI